MTSGLKKHSPTSGSSGESTTRAPHPARWLPLAATGVMAAVTYFAVRSSGMELSPDTLLHYTPENPLGAALVLLLLFALKSLTVFFPLVLLYLACGIQFTHPVAICISILGLAVAMTIPYLLGRFSGREYSLALCSRYPKLQSLHRLQDQNRFFLSFLLRAVGVLPCDIVSLYMGSTGVPYPSYLLGGLLGSLPDIIATTILGAELYNPGSPLFLGFLLLRILLAFCSCLLYHWVKQKYHL